MFMKKRKKSFDDFRDCILHLVHFNNRFGQNNSVLLVKFSLFFVLLLNDYVTTVFMITWTTKSEWYERYNMCSSLLYTIRLVFNGYRTKTNQDVHTSALNNITTLLFFVHGRPTCFDFEIKTPLLSSPPYVVNFTFHNDWLILAGNLRVIITLQ